MDFKFKVYLVDSHEWPVDFVDDYYDEYKPSDEAMYDAFAAKQREKAHARNKRRNRRSRDNSSTLKHNVLRHCGDTYDYCCREDKRKRYSKHSFERAYQKKRYPRVDLSELKDTSDSDVSHAQCVTEATLPKFFAPWSNTDLVLYLYDEALDYISSYVHFTNADFFNMEMIRVAILEGNLAFFKDSEVDEDEVTADTLSVAFNLMVGRRLARSGIYYEVIDLVAQKLCKLFHEPDLHLDYLQKICKSETSAE